MELSSRKPDRFELSDGQKYIPISAELGRHSLSAILLDDAYFGLIQAHHDERDGYGLDKAARLEAQQQEEQAAVPELEPEFPFTVVVFDPAFFGVTANPSGVNGG